MSENLSDPGSGSIRGRARKRRSILVMPFLLAVVAASGCGGDTRVPVFPVSGRVTFQGKAPEGAQVILHPTNGGDSHEVAPTGIVKKDGSFEIGSYSTNDGAPQGDYVVTVLWFKTVTDAGGSGAGPNVLPPNYASPTKSPIKVSVNGGPTEIPPITIASK